MKTIRQQVTEFHKAGGIPIANSPCVPPDERVRLRLNLILEEATELMEACLEVDDGTTHHESFHAMKEHMRWLIKNAPVSVDLPQAVDAFGDIDYVVEGSRLEFGVFGAPVAIEIHRVNMTKFPPGFVKRDDGKILKPEGFTPPDIEGVLWALGWKP